MSTLRISVLLIFTTMLIPIGASAHCEDKHGPGHPHCDTGDPTDPGDSITYVATLTGAFAFDTVNNSVDVTANKQGNVLKSAGPVTLIRPGGAVIPSEQTICATDPVTDELCLIWNSVFVECPHFFGPTPVNVTGFKAPAGRKGWTIEKPGGVRVIFRDIPFPQEGFPGSLNVESAWVALSLIGDRDFDDPFPPTETIQLSHFTIHGQTESGVTPRLACADENFALKNFPISPPIYLTITATETE
jgi:hypothetical protein